MYIHFTYQSLVTCFTLFKDIQNDTSSHLLDAISSAKRRKTFTSSTVQSNVLRGATGEQALSDFKARADPCMCMSTTVTSRQALVQLHETDDVLRTLGASEADIARTTQSAPGMHADPIVRRYRVTHVKAHCHFTRQVRLRLMQEADRLVAQQQAARASIPQHAPGTLVTW